MANPEHVAKLKEGVEAWNEWTCRQWLANWPVFGSSTPLPGVPPGGPDLDGLDLSGWDLSGANFARASLKGARLIMADLTRADLSGADLSGTDLTMARLLEADLSWADLSRTNFVRAKIYRANLHGANLFEVNLNRADLIEADLSACTLWGTNFGDVDLSTVKGLETCTHIAPSVLDHRTLARSGKLPLSFLRGCGLSDTFIDYIPSLFNQPIQFYSCFISYSTKDQEFADRLYADLQNKGVRCWFAPHDIQGGKKIHEQLDDALKVYDRLLLILSENSMKSRWVQREIRTALERERAMEQKMQEEALAKGTTAEKRRALFPVGLVGYEAVRKWTCFDADLVTDLAQEVREYYVPDFSEWKDHDSYQREFEKLVRDLKAK